MYEKKMYEFWRVPALQEELRHRGLEARGSREELIARLRADDEARGRQAQPEVEQPSERRGEMSNIWRVVMTTVALVAIGLAAYIFWPRPAEPVAAPEVDLSSLEEGLADLQVQSDKLAAGLQQLALEARAPVEIPVEVLAPVAAAPAAADWPESAAEASATFGGEEARWEVTPDEGWHLREESYRTLLNPSGFALEGYYDTNPGRDPRQFVSVVALEVQGATIWQAAPGELFCAMIGQKFPGLAYDLVLDQIDAVGFTKPTTCP